MFRSLLKDHMDRRNLRKRDTAKKIGISVLTLNSAINNKPVDQEAVIAICHWLKLPNSPMFTSESEPIFGSFQIISKSSPELLIAFQAAGEEVEKGGLMEEEFRGLVKYAVTLIEGRAAEKRTGAEG